MRYTLHAFTRKSKGEAMKPIFRTINLLIVFILSISACAPKRRTPTGVTDVELAVTVLPIVTKIPTAAPQEATSTAFIENTTVPVLPPTDVPALIGTPIPERSEIIGADNYRRLKHVGQWGRGSIQGVGFTPDGKSFIAIRDRKSVV